MNEEQEIIKILDEMKELSAQGDFEKYISFYSDKKNYLHLGSGKNDHIYGREGMREVLNLQGKPRYRDTSPRQIYLAGNFAWVINELAMSMEKEELVGEQWIRVTLILEKEEDGWKIVHTHVSTPELGIEEGQYFPTISGFEKQITKWVNIFDLDPHLSSKIDKVKFKSYLLQAQKILQDSQED
ncbi:MAG: hypothetical protein HeimC2_26300 [Candidatus Heimdallarchaeota archaeon LC_2]|nr:MAG: hypothetical protein HeimC2_26300 [Candidatus Heimdallarchaeota archaeon LC_2]